MERRKAKGRGEIPLFDGEEKQHEKRVLERRVVGPTLTLPSLVYLAPLPSTPHISSWAQPLAF